MKTLSTINDLVKDACDNDTHRTIEDSTELMLRDDAWSATTIETQDDVWLCITGTMQSLIYTRQPMPEAVLDLESLGEIEFPEMSANQGWERT